MRFAIDGINKSIVFYKFLKLSQFVRWVHMNFACFVEVCCDTAECSQGNNVDHDDCHCKTFQVHNCLDALCKHSKAEEEPFNWVRNVVW